MQIICLFLYNKVILCDFLLYFAHFFVTLKRQMKKKQLSILIPVYNETCYVFVKKLAEMCDSMQESQRLTCYEILVADDASTCQECRTINRAINDIPHCRYMEKEQNTGSAATRNYLAKESRFDWLLFLDSDMEISHSDFLLRYLDCEAEGVINGGISIGQGSTANLRFLYEKHCEAQHTAEKRSQNPWHSFRSTNFLIPRDVMLHCPFDERFKKSGYEDVMLGKQLMLQGIDIHHIDNPMTMTNFEDNDAYMEKTERNLRTLHTFRKELKGFSQIADASQAIRPFICLWHWVFGVLERKILCGSHPRLRVYNAYRLGYYLTLKGQ